MVLIRILIPSNKQGIEVLYSTSIDQYAIDCINPFSTSSLFRIYLETKIFSIYAVPIQNKSFFLLLFVFEFKFLYFFHPILFLPFILTTLYRTNIIHRDKQLYLFPSYRFDFLP